MPNSNSKTQTPDASAVKQHNIQKALFKFTEETQADQSYECMKQIAFGLADSGWMDSYEAKVEIVGFLFSVSELIHVIDQNR